LAARTPEKVDGPEREPEAVVVLLVVPARPVSPAAHSAGPLPPLPASLVVA
jgi:hypothetical protein